MEFLHAENKTKSSFCIRLNFQKLIAVFGVGDGGLINSQ